LVPDDALWVVHLDVQAALESPVGVAWLASESDNLPVEQIKPDQIGPELTGSPQTPTDVKEQAPSDELAQGSGGKKRGARRGMVDRMLRTFGLDISKEIKGITVIGLAHSQETGLVFLTTDAHADRMGNRLFESECDVYEMDRTRPGWVIHRWKRGGRSYLAAVHTTSQVTDARLVILAETPLQLEAGIALLGERTVPENTNRLPRTTAKEGSIFFAAAADMNLDPERRPSATILREARSLVIDVGMVKSQEGPSRMYGNAIIGTADQASAQQVKVMIKGILSLLLPSFPQQDEQTKKIVTEMLEGMSIETHNDRCVLEISHDSKTVAKVAESFFTERGRRFREHKAGRKGADEAAKEGAKLEKEPEKPAEVPQDGKPESADTKHKPS